MTRTRSHSTFKSRLNALEVDGGDDCPEMSLGAIMRALRYVGHGSIVYVFTDASAKDHKLVDKVVKLIHQKKSTVIKLPHDCNFSLDIEMIHSSNMIAEQLHVITLVLF